MQAMMEVTEWASHVNAERVSHLYWMDGDVALAYCKAGTLDPIYFNRPFHMDLRGRKFVKVRVHPFVEMEAEGSTKANTKEVQGKSGKTYIVDVTYGTCTCPSFKFRGTCKHLTIDGE